MDRIFLQTCEFNASLGLAEVVYLTWVYLRLTRGKVVAWRSVLGIAPAPLALGLWLSNALTGNVLAMARLVGWALYVHVPILLIALALLFWREAHGPRWLPIPLAAAAFLCAAVGLDGYFIEPYHLEVNTYRITSRKLDGLAHPVRIAVVADIQIDEFGAYEKSVLARLQQEQPDFVIWAGDYIQAGSMERYATLRDLLHRGLLRTPIMAREASFAVGGNHDLEDWPRIFDGTSVRTFPEGGVVEVTIDRETLRFSALTDRQSADHRFPLPNEEGAFRIAFGHRPDFAVQAVKDHSADLIITGHTHGGQVQLPFWGAIVTGSRIPRAWASGVRLLGDTWLAVSRGVGMERDDAPQLRLLCAPEIMILELTPG